MERLETKNAPLAREVRRRDVTIGVMVTVIGFGHKSGLFRRRDRIGIEALGLCRLHGGRDKARSGMVRACWSNLSPFAANEKDARDQKHDERNSCEDYDGEKAGVTLSELRGGIVSCGFDLVFCGWSSRRFR